MDRIFNITILFNSCNKLSLVRMYYSFNILLQFVRIYWSLLLLYSKWDCCAIFFYVLYQMLISVLFCLYINVCGLYVLHQFKQLYQRLHLVFETMHAWNFLTCWFLEKVIFWFFFFFGCVFFCPSNWIAWVSQFPWDQCFHKVWISLKWSNL